MLGKLKALARSTTSRLVRAQDQAAPAAFSPETFAFPPMTPLKPPPAQNDDVLRPVYEAVERELRAAGLLP